MRHPLLASAFACSVAWAVGCSAPVAASSDVADAEVAAKTAAIVVVERTAGPGEGTRAEAVARFVQMRSGAVDEQALRLVGAATDFPALGACSTVGLGWGSAPARAVKLVDMGTVSLEANGVRTPLAARQLPDVADLVSGVVYTGRGESTLTPHTRYVLRTSGTQTVLPFEIPANAPAEPSEVRLSGQDGRGIVALSLLAPIDITWEPGSEDDLVYIDVAPRDASPVRCLFTDTGAASLSSAVFAGAEQGTVTLHRLHREVFRAQGIDDGEVRFDFARTVAFTRR